VEGWPLQPNIKERTRPVASRCRSARLFMLYLRGVGFGAPTGDLLTQKQTHSASFGSECQWSAGSNWPRFAGTGVLFNPAVPCRTPRLLPIWQSSIVGESDGESSRGLRVFGKGMGFAVAELTTGWFKRTDSRQIKPLPIKQAGLHERFLQLLGATIRHSRNLNYLSRHWSSEPQQMQIAVSVSIRAC
jgi:hypothetical protein